MNWQSPPDEPGREAKSGRSGWTVAGVVFATVLCIYGLVLLMVIVFFVVLANSLGGNK